MSHSNLIVFGEDWGGHPSSTQHVIRHLMPARSITWVNSIGLRRPRLSCHDIKRMIEKLINMTNNDKQPIDISESPIIISPKAIPLPGNPIARMGNRILLQKLVKTVQYEQNAINPSILWLSLPTAVDAIPNASYKTIYYCGDDFGALEGVDHKAVLNLEKELAIRADLILVASAELAKKFPEEKTQILPHGVDIDLFTANYPKPNDFPAGKKIAGFYGSLAGWVDVERIAYAAKKLPEWDFVCIGSVKTDITALKGWSNIHLLGAKPHNSLAAYASNWDVSLMPFKDNDQIKSCNPLKLLEYMAVGKPIVSSSFPALEPYKEWVSIADSNDDFVHAITQSFAEGEARRDARRAAIKNESWHARADKVEMLIQHIEGRGE